MTDSQMTPPNQDAGDESPRTNVVSVLRSPAATAAASPQMSAKPTPAIVSFDRRELQTILNLYGRKVADGEWRDYAIDFSVHKAVFSVYRRASETPLYCIEKDPKLARRQGAFSVVASTGLILKRGHDLARVIAVLDKKLKLVTA